MSDVRMWSRQSGPHVDPVFCALYGCGAANRGLIFPQCSAQWAYEQQRGGAAGTDRGAAPASGERVGGDPARAASAREREGGSTGADDEARSSGELWLTSGDACPDDDLVCVGKFSE